MGPNTDKAARASQSPLVLCFRRVMSQYHLRQQVAQPLTPRTEWLDHPLTWVVLTSYYASV